jgi:hypothetical protein
MPRLQIDKVKPALKGGNHGPSGWGLTVYSGIVGDDAPYRTVLVQLAASGRASFSLPEYEEGEDCVEGTLMWGDQRVDIYFECQALSYLAFWAPDREPIEAVRTGLHRQPF